MEQVEWHIRNARLQPQKQDLLPVGEEEVRVRVSAISLNFRDGYVVRGNAHCLPREGEIPFSDAVGVVEATGARVRRFKTGDRVSTTVLPDWIDGPLTSASFSSPPGVFASHIDRHEHALVAVPDYLTDAEAATLPVAALTAWHAVSELGALRAGQTVVVQSTGGVAVFAIQFAAAMGAQVIVVSRSGSKLAKARALGAWAVIDSVEAPDWDREVLKLTGAGAELVLDMGLDDSLRKSVRAAAFEGTVAIVGVVQQQSNLLDIYPVMNKNLRVRGVETGSRAMVERMHRFMQQHAIRPVIAAQFDAREAELALDYQARSPFGKVVLTMPS